MHVRCDNCELWKGDDGGRRYNMLLYALPYSSLSSACAAYQRCVLKRLRGRDLVSLLVFCMLGGMDWNRVVSRGRSVEL